MVKYRKIPQREDFDEFYPSMRIFAKTFVLSNIIRIFADDSASKDHDIMERRIALCS